MDIFSWTGSWWWIILIAAYLLTWLLIPWVLLKRTVHASAAVAWILSIIFVPFVGAAFCLIAGTTRWEQRTRRKQEASAFIEEQVSGWRKEHVAPPEELGRWQALEQVVARLSNLRVTAGNHVEIVPSTERSLKLIEQVVQQAERWIQIEFYIWRHDEAGTRLRDLLIRKAREGVEVRLLYDGFGSMWLGSKFLRPLKEAGVQTGCFTPGLTSWHLLTLNLRNHRKIVVCDGQVGVTGGMNIGEEYIRPTKTYGVWRDTQALVRGPAVLQLQHVFAQDWYYATGEALTSERFYPQPTQRGNVPTQVVVDGPDNDVDTFYSLFVAAIGLAQRSITLTTPYFVPPEGVAVGLETAARRGVQVRLMTAARGNFTWTLQAGRSYYESLLRAGVEIWEYQKGLYHPKTLVVDGEWSLVGTPNCDYRSFILNFEVALSLFDQGVAAELERQFEQDQQSAEPIHLDQWRQRSKVIRLHEQFWRLFAPVL